MTLAARPKGPRSAPHPIPGLRPPDRPERPHGQHRGDPQGRGRHQAPHGLAVTLNGREARFQFIAYSVPGDNFNVPETVVEGDLVPLDERRADGPEGWFAGLLAASGSREISGIEQWSLRKNPADRRKGLTVEFHDGSKIYARAL